jgi:uncharacterized protein (TIGR00255 family)
MIHSMTGYGSAVAKECDNLVVEVRSVNNRFLKVNVKIPETLGLMQRKVEDLVRRRVSRGTVTCGISVSGDRAAENFQINTAVADHYHVEIKKLAGKLGIKTPVTLELIMGLPGVLCEEPAGLDEDFEKVLLRVLDETLDAFLAMRAKEGEKIASFIRERTGAIGSLLDEIEKLAPGEIQTHHEKLLDRVRLLLSGTDAKLDEKDIIREVAIFAEKSDISEEVQRMRSHLAQLGETLEESGALGRKLEFITQELFREANTMAAKTSSVRIVKDILEVKSEVDRIREQVQNVE